MLFSTYLSTYLRFCHLSYCSLLFVCLWVMQLILALTQGSALAKFSEPYAVLRSRSKLCHLLARKTLYPQYDLSPLETMLSTRIFISIIRASPAFTDLYLFVLPMTMFVTVFGIFISLVDYTKDS